jgi:hypothetical protein
MYQFYTLAVITHPDFGVSRFGFGPLLYSLLETEECNFYRDISDS